MLQKPSGLSKDAETPCSNSPKQAINAYILKGLHTKKKLYEVPFGPYYWIPDHVYRIKKKVAINNGMHPQDISIARRTKFVPRLDFGSRVALV